VSEILGSKLSVFSSVVHAPSFMPTMLRDLPYEILRHICLSLVADRVKPDDRFDQSRDIEAAESNDIEAARSRKALSCLFQTCS
jgi:hypothetical protein